MKQAFFIFFAGLCITVSAQNANNSIVLGKIDSVYSTVLNEQRKLWVYVPESGPNQLYSSQKYPVVYLLDGDAHFYSVVGMIHQLSYINGNTICPQMIVVGIPNTDRTRDLTPSHIDSDLPYMDSNASRNSGGGEQFISFIEKELIPHIDSLYPTEPYRMLIGHSLGGLTVMNTLINHPNLFKPYVSIDPSIWWDKQKLLIQAKQVLAAQNYQGTALFLGIANTMSDGMDTAKVRKDTSVETKHIRSILELNKCLSGTRKNQLKYQCKYYKYDDHGSVPLITGYDALHFIFDFYRLKLSFKEYTNINRAVITKIEKHYENASRQMGYKMKVPENMANNFGYQALNLKHYDEAEYLFKLNVTNYPESSNVYDSLGDLYVAKGEKEKAITSFKKALSIKEVQYTREKLIKLETK